MKRPALLALCVALVTTSAHATGVMTEVTAGRSYWAIGTLGELTLQDDALYLTLGYSGARVDGDRPLSHQVAAGLDVLLGDHWLAALSLSGSPRSVQPVPLTPDLTFRAEQSSLGAQLQVAFDSAGFSRFEYGFDGGLSLTRWRLGRALETPSGQRARVEALGVLRPSAGAVALLDDHWELSMRGALYLYSQDPLTAGRLTQDELQAIEARVQRQLSMREGPLAQYLLQTLGGRLLEADAVSGIAAAPVQAEGRLIAARRFGTRWKGEVSWTLVKYVPTQGLAHVPSVRATFRPTERWRLWAAAAVQVDLPEDKPRSTAGLGTFGVEYEL